MDGKTRKPFWRYNGATFGCSGFCFIGVFYDENLTKNEKKYIITLSKSDSRGYPAVREESPGSTEQGCRLTTGGGDSKDSATENKRRFSVSVEM